jgi:hypothetical protein
MKSLARIAYVVASVVLCGLVLTACKPGTKQALRLNLQPGGAYQLLLRETAEVDLENPATEKKRTFRSTTEFALSLKPGELTSDGDSAAQVTVEKIQLPAVLRQVEAAMASYSFGVNVSPLGHVIGFSGTEGMHSALLQLGKGSSGADASTDPAARQRIDDTLRSLMEPVLAVWPSVPVAAGDTWTRSGLVHPRWSCVEETVFTVESIDDGVAIVSMKSTFTPIDAETNTSGSGTGEVRISAADGTVRAYKMTLTTTGTATRPETGTKLNADSRIEIQGELSPR